MATFETPIAKPDEAYPDEFGTKTITLTVDTNAAANTYVPIMKCRKATVIDEIRFCAVKKSSEASVPISVCNIAASTTPSGAPAAGVLACAKVNIGSGGGMDVAAIADATITDGTHYNVIPAGGAIYACNETAALTAGCIWIEITYRTRRQ